MPGKNSITCGSEFIATHASTSASRQGRKSIRFVSIRGAIAAASTRAVLPPVKTGAQNVGPRQDDV
jgi:hypothetical protein